jgi:hypothetical protein
MGKACTAPSIHERTNGFRNGRGIGHGQEIPAHGQGICIVQRAKHLLRCILGLHPKLGWEQGAGVPRPFKGYSFVCLTVFIWIMSTKKANAMEK